MEQRPQRQGYSDLEERQREGVPALEADEAAERSGRSGAATTDPLPGAGPSEGGAYAGADATRTSDTPGAQAKQGGTATDDLAAEVDEGGAGSGGQRSGGDGGMSSPTGG